MSFDIAAKVFSALRVARKKEFRNKVAIPGRMAAEVLGTYERNPFETSEDLRRFFEVSMVVEYALDELLQAAQELPVWPEGIEDLIDLINEGHQQFMEDTKRLARVHPLYKQGLQDGLELPGIALPPPDDSQAKDSPGSAADLPPGESGESASLCSLCSLCGEVPGTQVIENLNLCDNCMSLALGEAQELLRGKS